MQNKKRNRKAITQSSTVTLPKTPQLTFATIWPKKDGGMVITTVDQAGLIAKQVVRAR